MINRPVLISQLSRSLYPKGLSEKTLVGLGKIIDAWEKDYASLPIQWLAYIMATSYHETGTKMYPVREGFCESDKEARRYVARQGYPYATIVGGQVYYGRGHVQLTWINNYKKAGEKLGVDLVHNPDLALDSLISAQVLIAGMIEGWFTGKKLQAYFNLKREDAVGARRIVNGTDRSQLIAGYYLKFVGALKASQETPAPKPAAPTPTPPAPVPAPPPAPKQTLVVKFLGLFTKGKS